MNHYLLKFAGSGGELIVSQANPAFVAHWCDLADEHGLLEFINSVNWEEDDLETESPPWDPNGENPSLWNSNEPYVHVSGVYSDNGYSVVEIALATDVEYPYEEQAFEEVGKEQFHDFVNTVYGREAYASSWESAGAIPVVCYHSQEKGLFNEAILSIPGEFDPGLLAIGVVETDLCELVERVWYDGEELELRSDFAGTSTRDSSACVGWMEDVHIITQEDIQEGLNEVSARE